ncbi:MULTISPECIES: lysylphosphatidylglycerol synthase domain-containing protein [Streptomyces]|uniref:TIGR00374 family protein n=1 Tax=Streptomyces thermoviolaceus subsp. thermoviolaceus TaxID=66860 RepID=A0ABX0YM23_STRTL|nr:MULTISPECIES: lysylphosphatidylglycerol synthase domain-containing protein [Streptomyces]WTD46257.1 lysylphosphatidylglycerol synthase domain-containing protein [Streptomyces thermoviolaceus]NJP13586.1 TIGR00374 family protein [Streptomyces thermoviolaceus subsp. thermoviolaceus]RSS03529.1 TIGR00374 family protein [Streptomyces sp. WAC00469]GGV65892.1 membrane protein [Streptomyces thermoviolaceus subsp. apingens]GHA75741.1 membrane protein [Streptomyces thermoviolaceus subsp. thermoviolace
MTSPLAAAATVLRRRNRWQTAALCVVLLCAAWLGRRHWPVLQDGAGQLAGADQRWLLAGAAAAVATWMCAALAQQGAVAERLPRGRLIAAQFAASAANHVLPAGLGAGAVNLRFLMRCGLSAARSASALAVKAAAGALTRTILIAALAVACPGLLRLPPVSTPALAALAALPVLVLLATVLLRGPLRARCGRALGSVLADIRAVHTRPCRAAALWGGSLAFATAHALVVVAVGQAVGLPVPPLRVALLYLAASSAAALLPTPGGLGSLDAALAFALTTAGAPGSAAASAVLGYRLLTVWAPLLPGLVVLGFLIRRRAV